MLPDKKIMVYEKIKTHIKQNTNESDEHCQIYAESTLKSMLCAAERAGVSEETVYNNLAIAELSNVIDLSLFSKNEVKSLTVTHDDLEKIKNKIRKATGRDGQRDLGEILQDTFADLGEIDDHGQPIQK